jgi:hypothetical protein
VSPEASHNHPVGGGNRCPAWTGFRPPLSPDGLRDRQREDWTRGPSKCQVRRARASQRRAGRGHPSIWGPDLRSPRPATHADPQEGGQGPPAADLMALDPDFDTEKTES